MAYVTRPVDIDFSHVHSLMSMGEGILMKNECVMDMYLVYISVIFKLCLCIVTFISKLALGMIYERIIWRLDAE